jgi:hypothetical protein
MIQITLNGDFTRFSRPWKRVGMISSSWNSILLNAMSCPQINWFGTLLNVHEATMKSPLWIASQWSTLLGGVSIVVCEAVRENAECLTYHPKWWDEKESHYY